jgi:hypothetical protein
MFARRRVALARSFQGQQALLVFNRLPQLYRDVQQRRGGLQADALLLRLEQRPQRADRFD